ncbi:hypothetical protein DUT90_02495 [Polaribacter sp. WD7]|uniref:nucleotidyltransferase domain-containing protein n=1 Tax=Polaribacter sp. WD7 TaxID=2269061 RepID=UPI000DF2F07B|nr:nucleotidyltransferase family protein [Polaribacter sp. WD7]RCS28192.1 hypothetical protein DUT90_02495 [Polaribacter sp. WD7]
MTYKETLFFIGKCLTINQEKQNKIIVKNRLEANDIDWESIVKVSTAHYVFPALYCNLKKANFLDFLPDDLVAYMKHITDLNRERNVSIITQAKEINQLLLANNITPIFLKGTGNLLEGLYDDIAERMVGDVDFIVQKNQYTKTIEILKKDGYHKETDKEHDMTFHWHYPPLLKENKLASVEVHKDILKDNYTYLLNYNTISKNTIKKSPFVFESLNDKILNALLPKIINDNLYDSKSFSLRTMYDTFLLFSKKENAKLDLRIEGKPAIKLNNVLSCIQLTLNLKTSVLNEITTEKSYLKNYVKNLENSKTEKFKTYFFKYYTINKGRLNVFIKSFKNEEYRKYALKRLVCLDFYKRLIGIKPDV